MVFWWHLKRCSSSRWVIPHSSISNAWWCSFAERRGMTLNFWTRYMNWRFEHTKEIWTKDYNTQSNALKVSSNKQTETNYPIQTFFSANILILTRYLSRNVSWVILELSCVSFISIRITFDKPLSFLPFLRGSLPFVVISICGFQDVEGSSPRTQTLHFLFLVKGCYSLTKLWNFVLNSLRLDPKHLKCLVMFICR